MLFLCKNIFCYKKLIQSLVTLVKTPYMVLSFHLRKAASKIISNRFALFQQLTDPPGGEEDSASPHMKGVGMLFVSLRGVNFGLWSHLGCSGQNAIIRSRNSRFQDCTRRDIEKLYIINLFYLLDSCNQDLKCSLLEIKKRLDHAQIGLLQGFNSKFPKILLTEAFKIGT